MTENENKIKELVELSTKHLKLLNSLNKGLPKKEGMAVAFSLLLSRFAESFHSQFILSLNDKMSDCYVVARTIFETALNIGYFSVKGESVVEKAYSHSLQKSYRDLKREVKIKDIQIMIGLQNFEQIPKTNKLKKSIEEFTSKKGHELRTWNEDNVFKKIGLISEKYGKELELSFSLPFYYIYRHASEIIHGTVFGAMFSLGMTQLRTEWPNTDEEYKNYIINRIRLLLYSSNLLASAVIEIISSHFENRDIKNEAKEIITKLRTHSQKEV